ncbi:hypothetical protein EYF80_032451 [Liparis tanakae]|uniref:Uncharacterized protein n=1 Tax=Liparis tanakae TaxID=230148 RepID=A0A4Z2GWA2_9TELE|nr:hypothetical protein EYF80_032451 [Liparis tanakae]
MLSVTGSRAHRTTNRRHRSCMGSWVQWDRAHRDLFTTAITKHPCDAVLFSCCRAAICGPHIDRVALWPHPSGSAISLESVSPSPCKASMTPGRRLEIKSFLQGRRDGTKTQPPSA